MTSLTPISIPTAPAGTIDVKLRPLPIRQTLYGGVYPATSFLSGAAQSYVVKAFSKPLVQSRTTSQGRPIADNPATEASILTRFRSFPTTQQSPHIIQLLGTSSDANYTYLALEYCSQGELYVYVKHALPALKVPYATIATFVQYQFKQCVAAVAYLHHHNIVHRHLHISNILLQKHAVKVADFGLAAENVEPHHMLNTPIPSATLPPEMLVTENLSYDGRALDIWSLGIVLLQLLLPELSPYQIPCEQDGAYRAILDGRIAELFQERGLPIHEPIYAAAIDLLRQLLSRTPSARPSAMSIMNHPFVLYAPSELQPHPHSLTHMYMPFLHYPRYYPHAQSQQHQHPPLSPVVRLTLMTSPPSTHDASRITMGVAVNVPQLLSPHSQTSTFTPTRATIVGQQPMPSHTPSLISTTSWSVSSYPTGQPITTSVSSTSSQPQTSPPPQVKVESQPPAQPQIPPQPPFQPQSQPQPQPQPHPQPQPQPQIQIHMQPQIQQHSHGQSHVHQQAHTQAQIQAQAQAQPRPQSHVQSYSQPLTHPPTIHPPQQPVYQHTSTRPINPATLVDAETEMFVKGALGENNWIGNLLQDNPTSSQPHMHTYPDDVQHNILSDDSLFPSHDPTFDTYPSLSLSLPPDDPSLYTQVSIGSNLGDPFPPTSSWLNSSNSNSQDNPFGLHTNHPMEDYDMMGLTIHEDPSKT